jgi:glycosyltransferase involved in cell wall biosynthesis
VGELTRLVEAAGCGWNVAPEDPAAMAAAIREAAAGPAEARHRGDLGRAFALEHYDRRALAARFVSLVDDLALGRRGRGG